MFDDELEPIGKKPKIKDLDPMSVSELEEYIVNMRNEIERVEAEITKKKAHQDAVSSLFKS
ncbi:MAG: DUF1192 domain-containing protein [Bdellovibrionales bacterium]